MLKKLEIPMLVDPNEDLENHLIVGDMVGCPANLQLSMTVISEMIVRGSSMGTNLRRGNLISATRVIHIICDFKSCMRTLGEKICKDI